MADTQKRHTAISNRGSRMKKTPPPPEETGKPPGVQRVPMSKKTKTASPAA